MKHFWLWMKKFRLWMTNFWLWMKKFRLWMKNFRLKFFFFQFFFFFNLKNPRLWIFFRLWTFINWVFSNDFFSNEFFSTSIFFRFEKKMDSKEFDFWKNCDSWTNFVSWKIFDFWKNFVFKNFWICKNIHQKFYINNIGNIKSYHIIWCDITSDIISYHITREKTYHNNSNLIMYGTGVLDSWNFGRKILMFIIIMLSIVSQFIVYFYNCLFFILSQPNTSQLYYLL